ncbi:MAG: acyl transferase [Bacteroidia bacterium]
MNEADTLAFYNWLEQAMAHDQCLSDSQILSLFYWQARKNPVYADYLAALGRNPVTISKITDIPFLPIEFFKQHQIISCQPSHHAVIFESSGTTGSSPSRHWVNDILLYENHSRAVFESCYGSLHDWTILALLPAYLERSGSSLVHMIDTFLKYNQDPLSGFYLDNLQLLRVAYAQAKQAKRKVLLIGVSFALLDLAEAGGIALAEEDVLMETGGMKGRRTELIREALHQQLQFAFKVRKVHSEYGMTELLSQAYADGAGQFRCPPSMRILIRHTSDPFSYLECGRTGGINIIDFANIHSCAFLQTQDLGRLNSDGSFEVLGRFDSSDIRGCNLLVV